MIQSTKLIKILVKKSDEIDIQDKALKWFSSYIDGYVKSGVPQGTILDPLEFLIYKEDSCYYIKHCKIMLFANDATVYSTGNYFNEIINNLMISIFVIIVR